MDAAEPTSPVQAPPPTAVVDLIAEAEKKKELGNTAFRTKKFQDAIDHYTAAIGAF